MAPFDPTSADLARIDRARAEVWLREHGWEALSRVLPAHAGCWWRLAGSDGLVTVPADSMGDRVTTLRWREVLHEVAQAHDLHGLALWSVLVQWQAPPEADE